MKLLYFLKPLLFNFFLLFSLYSSAQSPTTVSQGVCGSVVANFNTSDNGYNSPSIYGSIFDSSLYYNASRGYWTDYLPPIRTTAPGFPRVLNIISPPYSNPNPNGTFNVGFYYIVNRPTVDRFQVRIISITQTSQGTITNVEATSGLQYFSTWSTPVPYVDNGPVPTPLLDGFSGFICIRLTDPDIVNSPTTTFRIEVSYIINEAYFAVFDNVSIGPVGAPLPVNFIGLLANRNADNSVSLKWDVSEEVNIREYQVEKSDNGSSFTLAGTVFPKGKSIYTFTNYGVPPNTIYYRVKSIDIDGRTKYSGVIKLPGSSTSSFSETLNIYPSPARDQITIAHKKLTRDAKMIITTIDGKILRTIIPAHGTSHTQINISELKPGMYFLKLQDDKGSVETVKLLKN